MFGGLGRLFLSIPVSYPSINKYVNIHFLLDIVSPFTTLTHQALRAIHQKPYSTEEMFQKHLYQIGGTKIFTKMSNPNPSIPTHNFPNVNRLGMDFLK